MIIENDGRNNIEKKNGRNVVFAVYPFIGCGSEELSFVAGDMIYVLEEDDDLNDGWWTGRKIDGRVGYFPKNFVTSIRHSEITEDALDEGALKCGGEISEKVRARNNLPANFEKEKIAQMLSALSNKLKQRKVEKNQTNFKSEVENIKEKNEKPIIERSEEKPDEKLSPIKILTPSSLSGVEGSSDETLLCKYYETSEKTSEEMALIPNSPDSAATYSPQKDNILNWNVDEVTEWLKNVGFESYSETFAENEIDGEALIQMNISMLKELGINQMGRRLRLMQQIKSIWERKINKNNISKQNTLSSQDENSLSCNNSKYADGGTIMSNLENTNDSALIDRNLSHLSIFQPNSQHSIIYRSKKNENTNSTLESKAGHFLPPSQVVYEGYLKTMEDENSQEYCQSSRWKRRYFILSAAGCLYWLQSPRSKIWYHSLQVGSGVYKVMIECGNLSMRKVFSLNQQHAATKKIYYFSTYSGKELKSWTKAIIRSYEWRVASYSINETIETILNSPVALDEPDKKGKFFPGTSDINLNKKNKRNEKIDRAIDIINNIINCECELKRITELGFYAEGSQYLELVGQITGLPIPLEYWSAIKKPAMLKSDYYDNWCIILCWCKKILENPLPPTCTISLLSSGQESAISDLTIALYDHKLKTKGLS